MESKKINQLATNVAPQTSDLTIIGDPITGVSKKITWLQVSTLIGTAANLQQVTDNGATTTNPIAIGGLTITGLATGVLKSDSGVISSVPFGAANGVATLGGDGKVPSIQLPSYVDDVVEVANYAALPAIGETGKIYITLDNNKVYRWTGSIYVEIAANNAVWGAITGTLSNQTDLQNALNAKQNSITLTTTGTSGAATLVGATLNIPNYSTDLSGYVPYTGATANVDLGTFNLTADVITGATGSFASSGGSDTFAINHSSGSGIALNITKGGAGEGLYINKTSGSGNAATIIGTLNATTLVKSGGTSSQFLKADGSVDSNSYVTVDTTQTITGAKTFSTFTQFSSSIYANAEIRLVNAGTSSVSFLQNISTVGTVSTGANMLGFNTNKDLYIASDGKGYSVIAFNNGGTGYTYTLPASNGTIALTSQLTSGTVTSVGLSSATSGVTIGSSPITSSGTITLAIATASGSQNGLLSSTDWTTFNNKQSALTNPVTGTGTTNYLPKFTGASTIGNSLIYDTGTRIAIGGTSATYGVLTVQSDAGQFCIQSNTTPGKQLQIGYDHTTNNSYLSSLEQGVAFTTLALQPNGGNVGIGISTAEGPLHIKGTIISGYVGIAITNTGGSTNTSSGIDFGVDGSITYNGNGNGQINVINNDGGGGTQKSQMNLKIWNGSSLVTGINISDTGKVSFPSQTAQNYGLSNSTASIVVSGATETVASCTITSVGKPIFVNLTGDINPLGGSSYCYIYIYRNGAAVGKYIIAESPANSTNIPFALTTIDIPGSGTHTYTAVVNVAGPLPIQFGETGNGQAPTILAIELL